MVDHWAIALFVTLLAVLPFIKAWADSIDTNGGTWFYDASGNLQMQVNGGTVSATHFVGDGSGLTGVSATYPQNISATNIGISNSLALVSSTLPTCDTAHAGTMRRSTNKDCWCDGSGAWKNVAPTGTFVSLLGLTILTADACP